MAERERERHGNMYGKDAGEEREGKRKVGKRQWKEY